MSLKGVPPLLSASQQITATTTSTSASTLTKSGEDPHSGGSGGSGGTMVKDEDRTSRSSSSQSVTGAGQSVWTIGELGGYLLSGPHFSSDQSTLPTLSYVSYVSYLSSCLLSSVVCLVSVVFDRPGGGP